ncbi:MAG: hypothetical protein M3Q36_00550 [bacterium]|nr:hypothetical protein [bacterium]
MRQYEELEAMVARLQTVVNVGNQVDVELFPVVDQTLEDLNYINQNDKSSSGHAVRILDIVFPN